MAETGVNNADDIDFSVQAKGGNRNIRLEICAIYTN